MAYNLFIDDERFPSDQSDREFIISRTSEDAKSVRALLGCPEFISFDHDLGDEDTSMKVIHWMIEQDLNPNSLGVSFTFIPKNFSFAVHSQNPVGAKNIEELLNSYLHFRNKNADVRI